jgi:hypothetical protein
MFCVNCGSQQDPGAKFCISCGGSLEQQRAAASEPIPAPVAPASVENLEPYVVTPPKPPRPKMDPKKKLILWLSFGSVAVIFIVLAAIPGLLSPLTETQMPSYNSAFLHSEQQAQAEKVCTDLQGAIPSKSSIRKYQARTAAMNSQATTLRKSLAFVNSHGWAVDSATAAGLENSVSAILETELEDAAVNSGIMGISDTNASVAAGVWMDSFKTLALQTCGVADQYANASQVLTAYDDKLTTVLADAANAPWYPQGYDVWSDNSDIAWQWVNHPYTDCYDCSYWQIHVIAKNGCPTGLYGEMDVLYNDSKYDYTNDLKSYAAAGRVSTLTFVEYPYDSNYTGQLTKIECY